MGRRLSLPEKTLVDETPLTQATSAPLNRILLLLLVLDVIFALAATRHRQKTPEEQKLPGAACTPKFKTVGLSRLQYIGHVKTAGNGPKRNSKMVADRHERTRGRNARRRQQQSPQSNPNKRAIERDSSKVSKTFRPIFYFFCCTPSREGHAAKVNLRSILI